jgi:alpha-tubulin suppressor-like RCC1 family protein
MEMHILYILTTGSKEFPKIFEKSFYNIDKYTTVEYNMIDNLLLSSIKIQSNLNKKYIKSVSCGENHVLFLTQAGMVFSLGKGEQGQLGFNKNIIIEPEIISSLLNYRVSSINSDNNHNIIIATSRENNNETNNSIIVFGDNSKGQIGIKNMTTIYIPVVNPFFDKVEIVKISLGENNSYVINTNGELFIFGFISSFNTRKKSYNIKNEINKVKIFIVFL